MMTYYLTAVNANHVVVPWLNGYLGVLVAQDLETRRGLPVSGVLG